MDKISCAHGELEATAVCRHVFQSLQDGERRGFNWLIDDDDGSLQAFCDVCWQASDEEWENLRQSGPTMICIECFKDAAHKNGVILEIPRDRL